MNDVSVVIYTIVNQVKHKQIDYNDIEASTVWQTICLVLVAGKGQGSDI